MTGRRSPADCRRLRVAVARRAPEDCLVV